MFGFLAHMFAGLAAIEATSPVLMIGGGHHGSGKRHKCARKRKTNRNHISKRVRRKHRRSAR